MVSCHLTNGVMSVVVVTDLEFERWCKRRRLYREPSVSPIQLKETRESTATSLTSHVNPEDLNREENYKEKVHALRLLGLEAVSKERRRRESYIHWWWFVDVLSVLLSISCAYFFLVYFLCVLKRHSPFVAFYFYCKIMLYGIN